MINEKLKDLYTKMYNELKSEGKNFDEIYEAIDEHCGFDVELWDLTYDDDDGSIMWEYRISMEDFLKTLEK